MDLSFFTSLLMNLLLSISAFLDSLIEILCSVIFGHISSIGELKIDFDIREATANTFSAVSLFDIADIVSSSPRFCSMQFVIEFISEVVRLYLHWISSIFIVDHLIILIF